MKGKHHDIETHNEKHTSTPSNRDQTLKMIIEDQFQGGVIRCNEVIKHHEIEHTKEPPSTPSHWKTFNVSLNKNV